MNVPLLHEVHDAVFITFLCEQEFSGSLFKKQSFFASEQTFLECNNSYIAISLCFVTQ